MNPFLFRKWSESLCTGCHYFHGKAPKHISSPPAHSGRAWWAAPIRKRLVRLILGYYCIWLGCVVVPRVYEIEVWWSLTEVCILIQNNTDTLDICRYIVDTQICKGCKLQLLTSIKTQPCFAVVICGFQFSVSTWSQTCPFHVKTGLQSPPWIRIAVLAAWTRIPPRWVALRVRKNHCENGNTKVRNAIHS